MKKVLFLLLTMIFVKNGFSQPFNEYTKKWATYFGGQGTRFTNVFTDSNGDIIALAEITGGLSQVLQDSVYYNTFASSTQPEFMYHSTLVTPSYSHQTLIAKFSSNGNLIKSLYLPYYTTSAKIDIDDNIYIAGVATLNNLGTPNVWQISPLSDYINQTEKGIMVKLNANFSTNWLTYVPSYYIKEFALDENFNIYGVTETKTTSGITNQNMFQSDFLHETNGNSYYDNGYLFKLNNQGNLQWATYYGLTNGISIDYLNGEIVTSFGRTNTALTQYNNDFYTANAYSQNPSSQIISKFDAATGQRIYSTYLGDMSISRIANDGENYYFYGYGSEVLLSELISVDAYQPNFSGLIDLYLGKFDPNINPIWGTYIGGVDIELIEQRHNISIKDSCLYVISMSVSDFDINSSNPYQNNNGGIEDLLIYKFSLNGDFIWGSYFGGDNSEYSGSLTPVNDSTFYLVGNTYSNTAISTVGSLQENLSFHPSYPNSNFGNGFIAQFAPEIELSVNELAKNNFAVYPNPTKDKITIVGDLTENSTINIYNALGQEVLHKKTNYGKTYTLSLSNLQSGTYFLTISKDNNTISRHKLIIE